MSRTVSATFKAAAFASQTGEVLVTLLTISHDSLEDGPLRLSSDPTVRLDLLGSEGSEGEASGGQPRYGTVSRGETYSFLPFRVTLPDESDDAPPAVRLEVDNVSRELVPLLRSTSTPAEVQVEILLASDLDTVEVAFPVLQVAEVDYDADRVTINLVVDYLAAEPFPAGSFDPSGFPGLFG